MLTDGTVTKIWFECGENYMRFARAILAAQGAATVTDQNLIRELQEALFFWMPSIAGQDGPDGERAENDSMLLMGWNGGNETGCYGDRMLATIDALKKARNEALLSAERAREERNREHVRLNAEWMAKCEELRKERDHYQMAGETEAKFADEFREKAEHHERMRFAIGGCVTEDESRLICSIRYGENRWTGPSTLSWRRRRDRRCTALKQ